MEYSTLDDPKKFFHQLGGLHDARIEGIAWFPKDQRMSIAINDLNRNFLGLPEYEGLVPANLVLREVRQVVFDIEQSENVLNIYDTVVDPIQTNLNIMISLWPSGRIEIICNTIEIHQQKPGS